MKAKKLSKSDIALVSGILNNPYTKYCFTYENPWRHAFSRYSRELETIRTLSIRWAAIEGLKYAKWFQFEAARAKFMEYDGKMLGENAIHFAAYYALASRDIFQVRRPDSAGNSWDYWHEDGEDVNFKHIPLFVRMDKTGANEYNESFLEHEWHGIFEEIEDSLAEVESFYYDSSLEDGVIGTTHVPTEGEKSFMRFIIASGSYLLSASKKDPGSWYASVAKSCAEAYEYERVSELDGSYGKNADGAFYARISGLAFEYWARKHGLTRIWWEKDVYAMLSPEDVEEHERMVCENDTVAFRKFMKKISGKTFTPSSIIKPS